MLAFNFFRCNISGRNEIFISSSHGATLVVEWCNATGISTISPECFLPLHAWFQASAFEQVHLLMGDREKTSQAFICLHKLSEFLAHEWHSIFHDNFLWQTMCRIEGLGSSYWMWLMALCGHLAIWSDYPQWLKTSDACTVLHNPSVNNSIAGLATARGGVVWLKVMGLTFGR